MDVLSFVIVGHVDHGKSTLIGRLLYDTDSLPPDKIEEVQKASAKAGRETEFAYLLDHLEEERKQGITIDTTQVFFKTDKRRYVIIDAPGHVEFVKNMITGASQAEAAVLIIDVTEGVKEHEWLKSISIKPTFYIPISAIKGDNVASKSENMGWYTGLTFLESLDTLQNRQPPEGKPLLMPIQDVYKIGDKRINVGRVESGVIEKGAEVRILPTGQITNINSIEKYLENPNKAVASECIGITTTDSVFLDRGNVVCLPGAEPALTDKIPANIFWMAKQDFVKDQKLTIRCATQETSCKIESINKRINSSTLEVIAENAGVIKNLEVAEVIIKAKKPVVIKDFNDVQELGRFVLVQNENVCAGGIIAAIS
ncbi:MAG: GTP-binding protein [Planctomycetota bacterium]|jgi:sulfate adenylyltransferase subunit 1 (EFTu-like GTPase family)